MKTLCWKALTDEEKRRAVDRPATRLTEDLPKKVREIVARVRAEGDEALRDFTLRFDHVDLPSFPVSRDEFHQGRERVLPAVRRALTIAAQNIETFHRRQMPSVMVCEVSPGIRCERHPRAIARVGLYAPGGTASLPSTVLMLGIPARIAGCPVRILCTPPRPDGSIDPHVLEAAAICGIERIFKIGGAQAVAAMAYGTASVPKVDKIFGPGNPWVTEAKEQVSRDPGGAALDMPAGPSEVLVIADDSADPVFVASDLLSQAEHGADSQVVLVALSKEVSANVAKAVASQLERLPRVAIASEALSRSLVIEVDSMAEAFDVSNTYAPEHLILQVRDAAGYKSSVRNAGSVFIGPWSPESAGDYATGTNHVLPTYGHARAMSGVSVDSFLKQITFQELTADGLIALGPVIESLAGIEGLEAHRNAVSVRLASLRAGRENG